ncbi:hypothetical protein ACFU98_35060 [Streptomyces sp. NPDC057575]|uniref:hypothetical protein n=1 Tax=unclassified Streptomyces TaxID=2593676 RepID=UPI003676428F
MNAEQWNEHYPVGTLVLAYPGVRPEDGADDETLITRTRTKAQVVASGDSAVWVDGHGAYINLTHVDPVTEEQWHQARIDRDKTTAARRAALLDAIRAYPSHWQPERAAFAMKRLGFGWVGGRTAQADLEALAADGHLTPVTEVVIRHYDVTTEATA